MVVEDLVPLLKWLPQAGLAFIVIAAVLSAFGLLFGYIVASFRHGPTEGFYVVSRVFFQAVPDLLATSPRRVWAIAKLAMRETIRRKVLLVSFAIFAILILFGGWFLDTDAEHPERVYIGFLGWGTQLLVIMLGLMISTFSLPADIKNKTIYTVTTKPVRSTEIVFGRILGFTLIGTLLLTSIWIVSYFFIWRGLGHSHTLDEVDIQVVKDGRSSTGGRVSAKAVREGFTSLDNRHRHQVEFFPKDVFENLRESDVRGGSQDGDKSDDSDESGADESGGDEPGGEHSHADGTTHSHETAQAKKGRGHTHEITINEDGTYEIGPPEENLLARVPIYATDLNYLTPEGDMLPSYQKLSVGQDWDYRSYIRGNSKSRAVFFFDGIKESRFSTEYKGEIYLPLNVQVEVFRSHKGNVEDRISASLYIIGVQENGNIIYETTSPVKTFETDEYEIQTVNLPRTVMAIKTNLYDDPPTVDETPQPYDIFDDIAKDGSLRLLLACNNSGQYIGIAKKDIFFRPRDNLFFTNFLKAYLGIWLQMLVVVSLGVMFSTFLSAIVSLLATLSGIIVGLNAKFLHDLATNRVAGGGPIESFYRIVTQQNMMNPLEEGAMSAVIKSLDLAIIYVVNSVASIMPDYSKINFFDFLAEGYDIEWQRLLIGVILSITFCLVTTIIGYIVLKTREIAA